MTPFHARVQRLLLMGVHFEVHAPRTAPAVPAALTSVIDAIMPVQARWNQRAIEVGHRYRSAYWSIYLLSALAVLFAVLPIALGWDDHIHPWHTYAGVWAIAEIVTISAVGVIYWRGLKADWQGQWLAARTQAELAAYLPLVATLVDFKAAELPRDWFEHALGFAAPTDETSVVEALCQSVEKVAQAQLASTNHTPAFLIAVLPYTIWLLDGQRVYHQAVAHRNHAMMHRVHSITFSLFGLTAAGALLHLFVHSAWLSVVTTFFPALGASLHGALAQSEAFRLSVTSDRLTRELEEARERLVACSHAMTDNYVEAIRAAIRGLLEILLEEHREWHMLIKPHKLPLG